MASVGLIVVASGAVYERYATALFVSAAELFWPSTDLHFDLLPGRVGWPDATLYRYHVLLEHADRLDDDYLFLVDADMRFEEPVGSEVLSLLVATQHPGFVGRDRRHLPYESRPESAAHVPPGEGRFYYAGGFVGGSRKCFLALAERIAGQIDDDAERGITARWHDESHLNRVLAVTPPTTSLSPAYCHPDDDRRYRAGWPELYARKLVALDKTPAERGAR